MSSFSISNKRRVLEISAVILTAIGKFIFMDNLNWRFPFVTVAIISWVSYIIYSKSKQPGITKYWGFRTDNFKTVLKKVLPFGLMAVVTFFSVGFYKGTLNISWHIIPILILYPIWGTIQQFLLIALTAGNLQDMKGQKLNKEIIILLSAILFGAIHYPFVWLMIATFILAIFYGWIYLSQRNLYVLGLFHGWLGGIFYYTVLERDPFMEMFGKLFNS
ncbi:MAG TPA: CPBP family intramembrane glutamic endopeptidase [Chitinophagaceae bacterium]